jgi:hypothetical protein
MVEKLKETGSLKACKSMFNSLVHLLPLMVWLANVGINLGDH